ncbi:Trihelix transcription factor PTL [Acorus calamus]|uniref:Trihelix transcription factor PTL n=1 Tax=Acorus calamus TaxID=4465 RepID=A0AAV9DL56_ACOCL|nr:Trihelix transcription factor PTL [Acorus calamus]
MESMEGQYGLSSDLRRLITAEDTFSGHRRSLVGQIMGEVMMAFPPPPPPQQQQKPLESGGGGGVGIYEEGCSKARWPRQETLTLLEILARLDPKTMAEEHGYQRSGKKCREKPENLNKYYKKTKEGKAGRQDGKHYRFFRQLEALYGDKQITFTSPIKDFNINHSITTSNHHHYFPTISNNNPDTFQAAPKLSESLN